MAKRVLICGGGGFIGHHLTRRLRGEGCWVRSADLHLPSYSQTDANDFVVGDLRELAFARTVIDQPFDEIYQLAADMGGAGYLFTGDNDAAVMHNSALINLNVLTAAGERGCRRIFYASSACVYPEFNQMDPQDPKCSEDSVYPAAPDSEYGWEKLFGERLYFAHARNLHFEVRVARYHNIFGPEGAWNNGREKAPAALCRKTAMARDGDSIEIWGDGEQTRSFLFVDECVEGTVRLMRSDFTGPVNIGSDKLISINGLVDVISDIAGKRLIKKHVPGPVGVRGRVSDNTLIEQRLHWKPKSNLREGLACTYAWIAAMVEARDGVPPR